LASWLQKFDNSVARHEEAIQFICSIQSMGSAWHLSVMRSLRNKKNHQRGSEQKQRKFMSIHDERASAMVTAADSG
jgi:hypothetical protein